MHLVGPGKRVRLAMRAWGSSDGNTIHPLGFVINRPRSIFSKPGTLRTTEECRGAIVV